MKRECGRCTVCCTVQGVKGLPGPTPIKQPGVRCSFLCTKKRSRGCGIYDTRPDGCQTYECLWLQGLGGPGDRPDRIGVVFEAQEGDPEPGFPYALARTTRRGKEKGKRAVALLAFLRAQIMVAIVHPDMVEGERQSLMLDDGDIKRPKSVRLLAGGVSSLALWRS